MGIPIQDRYAKYLIGWPARQQARCYALGRSYRRPVGSPWKKIAAGFSSTAGLSEWLPARDVYGSSGERLRGRTGDIHLADEDRARQRLLT